jgi:hypothetical protein
MRRHHVGTGRVALLTASALALVTLSGCGASSGEVKTAGQTGERIIRGIEATNNTLKYAIPSGVTAGSLHLLGSDFNDAVAKGLPISKILNKVAASDDPYGQAIASSVCFGLGQVASMDDDEKPTQEGWEAFLIKQVNLLLPTNPVAKVQAAVKRFTTTADLAQINPRLATTYYQECSRH